MRQLDNVHICKYANMQIEERRGYQGGEVRKRAESEKVGAGSTVVSDGRQHGNDLNNIRRGRYWD